METGFWTSWSARLTTTRSTSTPTTAWATFPSRRFSLSRLLQMASSPSLPRTSTRTATSTSSSSLTTTGPPLGLKTSAPSTTATATATATRSSLGPDRSSLSSRQPGAPTPPTLATSTSTLPRIWPSSPRPQTPSGGSTSPSPPHPRHPHASPHPHPHPHPPLSLQTSYPIRMWRPMAITTRTETLIWQSPLFRATPSTGSATR